jgi:hypothetical protein
VNSSGRHSRRKIPGFYGIGDTWDNLQVIVLTEDQIRNHAVVPAVSQALSSQIETISQRIEGIAELMRRDFSVRLRIFSEGPKLG